MLLRLTKEFTFEMAHALTAYEGKCRNIHGHSYRLFVTVEGHPLHQSGAPTDGMVIDFHQLKTIVQEAVVEPFDHALVLPKLSADVQSPLAGYQAKLILVDFQPTTENLLIHFSGILQGRLPQGARLYSLRLYETETSCAELIFD